MSLTKVSYSMVSDAPANVLDFGADPTGTSDSSSAIQAAIDTGKRVFVPAGTYLIADLHPLISNGYLNMYGEEGKTILAGKSGTRAQMGIVSTGVTANSGLLILENLIFQNFQYCIHYYEVFAYTHSAYITNCTFKLSSAGVGLRSGYLQRATITGCSFTTIQDEEIGGTGAIMLGNLNTTDYDVGEHLVSDNYFSYVSSTAAECHAIWATGNTVLINNNRITEIVSASPGDGGEAIYTKARNVYADGNIILNGGNGQGAITIKGSCLIAKLTNNNITGSAGSSQARSAFYAGGVENLVISGNYCESLGQGATNGQVVWITAGYTNLDFSNNIFSDCTASAYTLRIEPSSGLVRIANNTLNMSEDSIYGWWLDPNGGTFDSLIFDNNVTKITASNLSSGSILVCRIRLGQTASTYKNVSISNNVIVANDFAGVATSGLVITSTASATIDKLILNGNTVSGTADVLFEESWQTATNITNVGNTWNSAVKTVTNDASPSIANGNRIFKSANVTPTKNITDFDALQAIAAGTEITLLIDDAFTQVNNGSGILLDGAVNFKPTNGGSLSLMYNGSDWVETGRSSY